MIDIQPGSRRSSLRRNLSADGEAGVFVRLFQVGKLLLLLLLAAAVAQTYVSMCQKVDRVSRENQRLRGEIKEVENELITLRNLQARYRRFDFVSRQLARYNLPLFPAEPGQIRRIIRLTPEQAARVVLPRREPARFAANVSVSAKVR